MINRFNLVDEPFIPVSGNQRLSLKEIFTVSAPCELALNPWYFIPVMRLLMCIGQAAVPLKTEQDWQKLSLNAFREAVRAYLDEHHDAFYLYGERPFLQIEELFECAQNALNTDSKFKLEKLEAYTPFVAYGNNLLFRSDSLLSENISDADKALMIIAITSQSLASKRIKNQLCLCDYEKPKTGIISPFLGQNGLIHSFYLGHSVAQSVWLNLVSEDMIAKPGHGFTEMGRPCWELSINSENCPDALAMKETYLGRLVPMVRFCLLKEDNQLICTDGIAHHGLNEHFHELSMTCREGKEGLEALEVQCTRMPWRDLDAFLSFARSAAQSSAEQYSCDQLSFCYPHAEAAGFLSLWCGGISTETTKFKEQKINGKKDMKSSVFTLAEGTAIFNLEPGMLHFMRLRKTLERLSKRLFACSKAYFDDLFPKKEITDKKQSRKIPPEISKGVELFWQRLDLLSDNIMHLCFDPGNNPEAEEEQLINAINAILYRTYDEICPSSTARFLLINQKHRPAGLKNLTKKSKE